MTECASRRSRWTRSSKRALYKIFLNDMEKAEYDVMIAGYVLDPVNVSEVRALATSQDDKVMQDWLPMKDATVRTLATLLRRENEAEKLELVTRLMDLHVRVRNRPLFARSCAGLLARGHGRR